MTVRAKFKVDFVTDHGPHQQIKLSPVFSAGNEEWSRHTPCGSIELTITNPAASAYFKPGSEYLLDFKKVDAPDSLA
jgi:hypothetical protein